jgi:hypothetical protein
MRFSGPPRRANLKSDLLILKRVAWRALASVGHAGRDGKRHEVAVFEAISSVCSVVYAGMSGTPTSDFVADSSQGQAETDGLRAHFLHSLGSLSIIIGDRIGTRLRAGPARRLLSKRP